MNTRIRQAGQVFFLVIFTLMAIGIFSPLVLRADVNDELFAAATNGNIDRVKRLLETGADPNYKVKVNGFRPMMMAAYGGHSEIVKLLIEKGAHIDVKDNNGETPLLWAASGNRLQIAEFLIENGADVNAKDDDFGRTVLMQVSSRASVVLGPASRPAEISTEDRVRFVQLLIDKGAEINAKAYGGLTALMEAAFWGLTEVAGVLIDNGADVNAQTNADQTALMSAAYNGHAEMVKLLVSRGADVNARDKEGRTVLLRAMRRGDRQIVNFLKKAGAKD